MVYRGPYKRRPLTERFWEKVDRSGGPAACWPWKASRKTSGYGQFIITRESDGYRHPYPAHRVAWEIKNGPIPDGLYVCHHCDERLCCNPDHLFLGDHAANMDDMVAKGRNYHPPRPAYCKRGHPLDEQNTYWHPKRRVRDCRTCRNEATRRSVAKRKASEP